MRCFYFNEVCLLFLYCGSYCESQILINLFLLISLIVWLKFIPTEIQIAFDHLPPMYLQCFGAKIHEFNLQIRHKNGTLSRRRL